MSDFGIILSALFLMILVPIMCRDNDTDHSMEESDGLINKLFVVRRASEGTEPNTDGNTSAGLVMNPLMEESATIADSSDGSNSSDLLKKVSPKARRWINPIWFPGIETYEECLPMFQDAAQGIVSVRYGRAKKYYGDNHRCSGVIVSPRRVVTTAVCVMNRGYKMPLRPAELSIVAGNMNRLYYSNTTQIMAVSRIYIHGDFNTRSQYNDIAIIELVKDLVLDNETTLLFPQSSRKPAIGTVCDYIGWSRLIKNGPMLSRVVKTKLFVASEEFCSSTMNYNGSLMICATGIKEADTFECVNDYGGPLICEGKFVGVLSWFYDCSTPVRPAYFTSIHPYANWMLFSSSAMPRFTIFPRIIFSSLITVRWFD